MKGIYMRQRSAIFILLSCELIASDEQLLFQAFIGLSGHKGKSF